jgi:hypothetical protein
MRIGRPRPAGRSAHPVVAVCTVLAVIAGLVLPVLAARLLAVEDPNDTAGLLDVHEVRFRDAGGEPPAWTVITFRDWTTRAIWDRGYVLLFLDTLGSPRADYYALVRADRDRLVGSIWRDRAGATDHRLFVVAVRKRGGAGVEVRVPLRRLSVGTHRTLYRWSVATLFTGGACHRTCVDPAPDDTMVEQPLPTSSPTPT